MQTHDLPDDNAMQKERAEKLMRAHNLMQVQLMQESGMDEMDWVERFAADFRDTVTEQPGEGAQTILAKRAIMFACLKDDIEKAVSLFHNIRPDFPKKKAA